MMRNKVFFYIGSLALIMVLCLSTAVTAASNTIKVNADPNWGDTNLPSNAAMLALGAFLPTINFDSRTFKIAGISFNADKTRVRIKRLSDNGKTVPADKYPWTNWKSSGYTFTGGTGWAAVPDENYAIEGEWVIYHWSALKSWHPWWGRTTSRTIYQKFSSGTPTYKIEMGSIPSGNVLPDDPIVNPEQH